MGAHAIAGKVAADRDLVGAAVELEHQAVAHAADGNVATEDTGLEAEHIAFVGVGVGVAVPRIGVVVDGVLSVTAAKHVGV